MKSFLLSIIGIVTIFSWVFISSTIVWLVIKHSMGIRVSEADEYNGMDMVDCGIEAYPEFVNK